MTTRFVDTNILIEVYLRTGEKSVRCLRLLRSEEGLLASWLVIGEFEWVLRSVYELDKEQIIDFLGSVLNVPALEIPNKKALLKALYYFRGNTIDWTDCLNLAIMEADKIRSVYSYDRDFDKFSGIKRLEP